MTRTLLAVGVLASLLKYQPTPPELRIVVLKGEDAINVIQQKTAVQPLVEVRDRNNLPVAGATVTFTLNGGAPAAFAGGAQTLTITTNAAGQAAVSGLNAVSSGAFQIQVQAAYQGQIVSAAISQTNFATAAAAAQAGAATGASGAGGTSGGAAAGAAGGGGGISATTIGIVGAAVAGGAVAATQLTGSGEGGGSGGARRFSGPISGQLIITNLTTSLGVTFSCVSTRNVNGTLTITLRDGSTTGSLETSGSIEEISRVGPNCGGSLLTQMLVRNGDVTGGPTNLTSTFETTASSTGTANVTVVVTTKFTGSLSGDVITGTFSYQEVSQGTGTNNSVIQGSGQTNFAVTLR